MIVLVFALTLIGCSRSGNIGIDGSIPLELQGDRTVTVQSNMNNKQQTFVFNVLPKTEDELGEMPEAALTTPFMTAALTVAAFCAYNENPSASIAMLNVLRGPQPLSAREAQFLRDCLKGKPYKPFSYFDGATPQNGYTPNKPYQITVFAQTNSYQGPEHVTLYIRCGGADITRPVSLRLKPSTGQWFLVGYSSLLLDMRPPDSMDPWR